GADAGQAGRPRRDQRGPDDRAVHGPQPGGALRHDRRRGVHACLVGKEVPATPRALNSRRKRGAKGREADPLPPTETGPAPRAEPGGGAPEQAPRETTETFVRHSAVMSIGTGLSRLTGFVRVAAMAYALGVAETRL